MAIIISQAQESDALERAVAALAAGQCVALPTETVYGLAGDATNGEAIARIFEIKGRPRFNPLICHVDDLAMAGRHGRMDAISQRLAERFWPGPLTVVVDKRPDSAVHPLVTAGLETIALRAPESLARDVIRQFGGPVAAPSANRSGRISPTRASHVIEDYPNCDLLVLDGGSCPIGIESTIVRAEQNRVVVLRPGGIPADEIEAACGLPVVATRSDRIEAPGMMESHYAPQSRVLLNWENCPVGANLLAFGKAGSKDRSRAAAILNLSEKADLREAAANLYHHLKALDSLAIGVIAVEPVPTNGLGAAINDRLKRAAAPKGGG